ncbi:MAG: diacylglycerol/lipid kinase family protein [Anaerosomatales bacterium]
MRILLVVNLKSGQGDAGVYEYVRALVERGAEVTVRDLHQSGDVAGALRDAAEHDRVVAAGGDGTVSAICYTLANSGIPVLAYPAGTANVFALNMRMPADPEALAHITLDGQLRDIDLGEFTYGPDEEHRQGFIVAAGAGFDAAIMEAADRLKPTLGAAAYFVGALQNLTPTVSRFTLHIDGRTVHSEGIAVLVMNVARLQFDLALTHRSDPADGLFEVVVVRTKNVPGLIPTVWGAFFDRFVANPDHTAGLEVHSAQEVVIEAEPDLSLQYDGEVLPATTPLRARVLPGATRLILP